jgi:hypothetical protein
LVRFRSTFALLPLLCFAYFRIHSTFRPFRFSTNRQLPIAPYPVNAVSSLSLLFRRSIVVHHFIRQSSSFFCFSTLLRQTWYKFFRLPIPLDRTFFHYSLFVTIQRDFSKEDSLVTLHKHSTCCLVKSKQRHETLLAIPHLIALALESGRQNGDQT